MSGDYHEGQGMDGWMDGWMDGCGTLKWGLRKFVVKVAELKLDVIQ
jgi:hypothetical protein